MENLDLNTIEEGTKNNALIQLAEKTLVKNQTPNIGKTITTNAIATVPTALASLLYYLATYDGTLWGNLLLASGVSSNALINQMAGKESVDYSFDSLVSAFKTKPRYEQKKSFLRKATSFCVIGAGTILTSLAPAIATFNITYDTEIKNGNSHDLAEKNALKDALFVFIGNIPINMYSAVMLDANDVNKFGRILAWPFKKMRGICKSGIEQKKTSAISTLRNLLINNLQQLNNTLPEKQKVILDFDKRTFGLIQIAELMNDVSSDLTSKKLQTKSKGFARILVNTTSILLLNILINIGALGYIFSGKNSLKPLVNNNENTALGLGIAVQSLIVYLGFKAAVNFTIQGRQAVVDNLTYRILGGWAWFTFAIALLLSSLSGETSRILFVNNAPESWKDNPMLMTVLSWLIFVSIDIFNSIYANKAINEFAKGITRRVNTESGHLIRTIDKIDAFIAGIQQMKDEDLINGLAELHLENPRLIEKLFSNKQLDEVERLINTAKTAVESTNLLGRSQAPTSYGSMFNNSETTYQNSLVKSNNNKETENSHSGHSNYSSPKPK